MTLHAVRPSRTRRIARSGKLRLGDDALLTPDLVPAGTKGWCGLHGKWIYRGQAAASTAAYAMMNEHQELFGDYRNDACGHWHVGHVRFGHENYAEVLARWLLRRMCANERPTAARRRHARALAAEIMALEATLREPLPEARGSSSSSRQPSVGCSMPRVPSNPGRRIPSSNNDEITQGDI